MLLDLQQLNKKYNLYIKGVAHVGAHFGQEFNVYKQLGINNVIFFEPCASTFQKLKQNIADAAILVNTALGNMIGEIEMYTETFNSGQSSSLLKPLKHLAEFPLIEFNGREKVSITKLDTFLYHGDDYNFLNIDVQGYELEVLKGGAEYLNAIDYIVTEVNRDEVYKNCARIEEIDDFLKNYNFERVETVWFGGENGQWGDAFYIKRKLKTAFDIGANRGQDDYFLIK